MIGGGVPKNFAQDTVVAAEMLGFYTIMHKYTIQVTVAGQAHLIFRMLTGQRF